jgi:hypothetical protein
MNEKSIVACFFLMPSRRKVPLRFGTVVLYRYHQPAVISHHGGRIRLNKRAKETGLQVLNYTYLSNNLIKPHPCGLFGPITSLLKFLKEHWPGSRDYLENMHMTE